MKTAWWHCFAGIAGDMAFGSLVDAGASLDEVLRLIERIPVGGWNVEAEATERNGIAATHLEVRCDETGIIRTHAHIQGLLEEARLPVRVRDRALAVFDALANAEGALHRRPPSQVHFHEVGGLDAIIDVVGTCAALEVLGIDTVFASPVSVGMGMVRTAHGLLPNPAPAVVALLASVGAPTNGVDLPIELTTPTGAALLAALTTGFGPLPAMTISATGFGAGSRTLEDMPNLTQVIVGATVEEGSIDVGQPAIELAANVDDATGETLAHAVAAALDAGAFDAWIEPVVMKKGRPGHIVCALVDAAVAAQVARVLTSETGSLGVRSRHVTRWMAERSMAVVDVEGMNVRVKVSPGRVKAEHDDAVRVARLTGLPAREVSRRAEEGWRDTLGDDPA